MRMLQSGIAGGRIATQVLAGQAGPLVFLHGLGGAGTLEYRTVAGDEALQRYRSILFDWPGHGASDAPRDFDCTTTSMALVAQELLDRLCPGEAVMLFGHSMGGAVAIELAELLGDRCRLLVLAEANTRAGGGITSSRIATVPPEGYGTEEHHALRDGTGAGGRIWHMAHAQTVHRCARALVAGVEPGWMGRLLSLNVARAAIVSDAHADHPDAGNLERAGIPLHVLPDSGHSMALDNPSGLAAILSHILRKEIPS